MTLPSETIPEPRPTPTAKPPAARSSRRREGGTAAWMVSPAVILLTLFLLIPVVLAFTLAFTNARLICPETGTDEPGTLTIADGAALILRGSVVQGLGVTVTGYGAGLIRFDTTTTPTPAVYNWAVGDAAANAAATNAARLILRGTPTARFRIESAPGGARGYIGNGGYAGGGWFDAEYCDLVRLGTASILAVGPAMEYRPLGRTGVSVSKFCLGAMMFGAWGNPDHDDCVAMMHKAFDAGINFVDTADVYAGGETEEIVGKSLEELRGWTKDDILDLLGIEIGPVRLKCALLPLKALKAGVWGVEESET